MKTKLKHFSLENVINCVIAYQMST